MKRLVFVIGAVALTGCASQEMQPAAEVPQQEALRIGAGDELGWQLQVHDRAITSANAEERDLASHE